MVNRQVNRRDKGGRGGFDYRPSDPKKLKERAERSGGQFDSLFKSGIDMLKPKVGENCYRILPPTFKDPEHFGLSIWVHGYIGPDKQSYLCLKKHLGKKCAACDAQYEAADAGEKDEADELKAKEGVIYWALDRDGDGEPELWKVSNMADKEISGRCEKRSGKILEVDNPWEGHDVIFKRTGQGLKTRYINWELDSDKSALADTDKETNRLLDFVKENPLDEVLKFFSYDHISAALNGTSSKKDPALDDDEKPRGRKRGDEDEDEKPRGRRGGDEDEDEKPRGRKREEDEEEPRGRGRSRDEDEDDKPRGRRSRDEEDDDRGRRRPSRDEEEEAPRSRSRSREEEKDPADEDDDRGDDADGDRRTSKKSGRGRDQEDERDTRVRSTRSARTTRERGSEDEDEVPRGRRGSREEEVEDEIPSSRRASRDRD